MSVARWMGCLALLLGPAVTATTYADSSGTADPLDSCKGLPARGRMARHEPVGEDAVYVVARSGERYLAFPEQEDGCEVFSIGAAAPSVAGHFGAGSKALALRAPRCAGGNCSVAMAVRGKDDRPLLALRTDLDCDISVEPRLIKLFPDRDTIEVVCRNSAGAGWKERHAIFDATEDTLVTLYSVDIGSYIAPTAAEKKAGECGSSPVGSLRVEKVGDKPLLRVVDPATGTLQNGKGTVPARQLGYDPKRRTFTPTGAPDVPTSVDAHAGCRR
jgi:hypothetical protein